ncbi:MAG: PAS domain-containing protein [Actinomycetota bacterium]
MSTSADPGPPGEPEPGGPKPRRTATRDLILVSVLVVVGFVAATRYDLAERLHAFLQDNESIEADELTIVLALLALGLGVFALLRWNERRTESRAREAAETRYRQLVERVPAITYVWDAENEQGSDPADFISPQLETLLGYTPEEWTSDPGLWDRLVHPEDHDLVIEAWRRALDEGAPFRMEYRIEAKDGRIVWVRDEAVSVRGEGGRAVLQGVMFDITERVRIEHALRDAEERYRTLVESVPTITYIESLDNTGLLYVSPQITTILGWTPDEYRSLDPWRNYLHPDDRDWVLAADRRCDETLEPFDAEYRQFAKDGREVWISEHAELVRDEEGEPQFWLGIRADITERKRAEHLLRQAEERYRTLIEHLPAAVYLEQPDDVATPLYMSPRYAQITGYTAEERMRDRDMWIRLLHPEDRDRVLEESARTNRTGEPFSIEYRMQHRDGHWVWVRDEASLVGGDEGEPRRWQGVLLDITERKRAEDDLRRRDAILGAVGHAAQRFLKSSSWDEDAPGVLAQIGEATAVSRVYVYENLPDAGEHSAATARCEWLAEGIAPSEPAPPDAPWRYEPNFARWPEALGRGEVLYGTIDAFPASERNNLERERIRSLAVVPIFVDDVWWGFIGLEDCVEARRWSSPELESLRAAADILGTAIGRQRAGLLLAETERRFRNLVEQIPAVTYLDAVSEGVVPLYVSPQYESMFGYTPEERMQTPGLWERLLHPDDRERAIQVSEGAIATGNPHADEYRMIARDGRIVWVRDQSILIRDEDGIPQYWQGILIDISAQKEIEGQLRDTEARYRMLVEQLPAVTYVDTVGRPPTSLYISPQIIELTGFTVEEWQTDPMLGESRIHEDDRQDVMAESDRTDDTLEPFRTEYRFVRKDGTIVWIREESEVVRGPDGDPLFWQGIMYDVTESRQAQEQLQEAEERFRTLVETVPAITYVDSVEDLHTMYVSPQVESMLGISQRAWLEDDDLFLRNLHPDDHKRVLATLHEHNTKGALYDVEYRFRHADGSWRWIRDQAQVVHAPDGTPIASQGVMFDITDQRETQESLRETEERFRALVETIPAALYIELPDADVPSLYVSPQLTELAGITPEEYLADATMWERLLHPDDRARADAEYRAALSAEEPWSIEYRLIRPDGREVWINDRAQMLRDDDGKVRLTLGFMFDVTEQKLYEQTLKDREQREREAADRLRALDDMKNTFLAAVSHELRSPLTSILGLSLTLERQQQLSDDDKEDLLARLAANARKLDRLLKDLLDIDRLSRGIVEPQYRTTDVGALVRRTIESLDSLGGRTVIVQTEPVVVPVDPAKVERIVENLVSNAARHTDNDVTIWVRLQARDSGAELTIEDDGPGIPKDIREAVFEPFRQGPTVSKAQPGTGIGLSLVARFAELHGGRAWATEREGGGASFHVFLPGKPPRYAGATSGEDAGGGEGATVTRLHPADAG